MIDNFNKVSNWVEYEILSVLNVSKRALVVKKFIKILQVWNMINIVQIPVYLSIYLSIIYLYIYHSIYLSIIYLSIYQSSIYLFLSSYLSDKLLCLIYLYIFLASFGFVKCLIKGCQKAQQFQFCLFDLLCSDFKCCSSTKKN